MNFYNYLVNVVEDMKKSWEESRAVVEPEVNTDVKLTYDAGQLKKDVIKFYDKKISSAITKDDLISYTKRLEMTCSIPNAAWNKMALEGSSAYINTLWFIAFWNGDVDSLII